MPSNLISVTKCLKRYCKSSLVSLSTNIYYIGKYKTLNEPLAYF